jgi:hypothetical protein
MTRAEVVRTVAADPAGIALLLSGPGAYGLWPGVDDSTVRLRPPMRSGVGFVVDLAVDDPVLGAVRARLSIAPADAAYAATVATALRLVVTADGGGELAVRDRAAGFLDALARQAQARSSAA